MKSSQKSAFIQNQDYGPGNFGHSGKNRQESPLSKVLKMGSSNPNQYDQTSQKNAASQERARGMGHGNGRVYSQKVLDGTGQSPPGESIQHQGSLSSWNDPKKVSNDDVKDDEIQNSTPQADAILPPAYNLQNEPAVANMVPIDTNGQNSLTDMVRNKNFAFSKFAQQQNVFNKFQPLANKQDLQTNLLNQVKKMQKQKHLNLLHDIYEVPKKSSYQINRRKIEEQRSQNIKSKASRTKFMNTAHNSGGSPLFGGSVAIVPQSSFNTNIQDSSKRKLDGSIKFAPQIEQGSPFRDGFQLQLKIQQPSLELTEQETVLLAHTNRDALQASALNSTVYGYDSPSRIDTLSPHFRLQNANNSIKIQKSFNSSTKKGTQNPILVSVANGEDGVRQFRDHNTLSTNKSNENNQILSQKKQSVNVLDSENKNSTEGKQTVNYGTFNLVNMNTSELEQAERSKYADTDILSQSQISRKKSGMNATVRKQSERKTQLNKDIDMVETAKSSYRKRAHLTERSESQVINQVNSPSNNQINQKAMTPVPNTTVPQSMQSNSPSNPALGIQGQSVMTINTRKPIMTSNQISPQTQPPVNILNYQLPQLQMDVGIGSDVPFNQDDYKQSSLDNSMRSGSDSQKSGVISSKRVVRQIKETTSSNVNNREQEKRMNSQMKVQALQQKGIGLQGSPRGQQQIQQNTTTLNTKNSPKQISDALLSPYTSLKAALNAENKIYNSIFMHQEGLITTLKQQNRDLKQMNFRSPLIQTNLSQRAPEISVQKQKKSFRLKQANTGYVTPELGNTFTKIDKIFDILPPPEDFIQQNQLSKTATRELQNSYQTTDEEVLDNHLDLTPFSQKQLDKIKNAMPMNTLGIIENDTFSADHTKANPTPHDHTFNDSQSAIAEQKQILQGAQIQGEATFAPGTKAMSSIIIANEQSLKNSSQKDLPLINNVYPTQKSFGIVKNLQIDQSSSKNSIQVVDGHNQVSDNIKDIIQTQQLNDQSSIDIDEMLHDVQNSFGRRRKTAFEKKERIDEEMRQALPVLTERVTKISNDQVSHAQYSMSEFRNNTNTRTPVPLLTSQSVFQQSSNRSPKMVQTMQNFNMNSKQNNLNLTASTFGKVTMADTSRMNKTLKDFDRPIPKHQLQLKTPNPDLAPFIERFNQSNALSKFSEILMKQPVAQDFLTVVPKPRRLESFGNQKIDKLSNTNPFDRKRLTMSQFDYSCSQQLSIQRNNAIQRTQRNFNPINSNGMNLRLQNAYSVNEAPLIVKKFENNGIQRERKFVVENGGIQIRNLRVKGPIFKEGASDKNRFKSVPKQRLSDAEALYLNQNIYKQQKSKDGFPFGLQTQLVSQDNRSKQDSALEFNFKADRSLENTDPHLVTLNADQQKTPIVTGKMNYNHDSGTLQREDESTGQIKKIEVSSSKRKKNLQINPSSQNSPNYAAMKSVTKSVDSSEYSQVSAKYSARNNLNGDESPDLLSAAGGEAINNIISPFNTSSNGANLQAIFTSGSKSKNRKTNSQKRSAPKQKESILKKKKIKKASAHNPQPNEKKSNELESLRSSQVTKTVESKERANKIKSIISIVEHNKKRASPVKKFAIGQRKVSVLTDDDVQYLNSIEEAKQMTQRRKLQYYTGGPIFKTIQTNSPSSGMKVGLPLTNSPQGQVPIHLHIQQTRSTHEENMHMRYPSSKFNSIGVLNPNSEINDRIWRQMQTRDLKVKFDKKGKGLIRLLDKDEYYGYTIPIKGALKDSGTQISPMVQEDEHFRNPSLLSLESLVDKDTQQGNKTGKFSLRVGHQSSATRDFEKYAMVESQKSQDRIQTYPLTTKQSQSVIVGPDGQLSAASPKSFKLITDEPGPTLIWFELITGELPTDSFTLGFDSQLDTFFMKSSHDKTRRLDLDQEQFFPEGIEMGQTIDSLQENIKEEIASRVNRNLNLYLNNELDDSIQIIISLAPRMLHNIVSKRSSSFMLPQQQQISQQNNQDGTREISPDIEVSQKGQGQSMVDDTEISNIDNSLTYNVLPSKKLNERSLLTERSPIGRQEAPSGLYFEQTPVGNKIESQGEVQVDDNTNDDDDQIQDSEKRTQFAKDGELVDKSF